MGGGVVECRMKALHLVSLVLFIGMLHSQAAERTLTARDLKLLESRASKAFVEIPQFNDEQIALIKSPDTAAVVADRAIFPRLPRQVYAFDPLVAARLQREFDLAEMSYNREKIGTTKNRIAAGIVRRYVANIIAYNDDIKTAQQALAEWDAGADRRLMERSIAAQERLATAIEREAFFRDLYR